MNAICNLHGSRFFRFLQPTLGFGSYLFDLNDPKDRLFKQIAEAVDDYHNVPYLNVFYSEILSAMKSPDLDFLIDITSIYDGQSRLFHDFRHPNDLGYKILAKNIMEVVFK